MTQKTFAELRQEIIDDTLALEAYVDTLFEHQFSTDDVSRGRVTTCNCGWETVDPAAEGSLRSHKEVGYEHVLDKLKEAGYSVVKRTGED